jgi:hypothetical protein
MVPPWTVGFAVGGYDRRILRVGGGRRVRWHGSSGALLADAQVAVCHENVGLPPGLGPGFTVARRMVMTYGARRQMLFAGRRAYALCYQQVRRDT